MSTKSLALLIMIWTFCTAPILANDLAIGRSAKLSGPVTIPIISPADFNFKSKEEIFRLRKQEILKHPELIDGEYRPSDEVFGQLVDSKPWWGVLGESYFGVGQNSIRGPAEESRFILNPFLLAGESAVASLDKSRVSESDLKTHRYPMFYQPTNLRWWPREGKAEVTYDISAYKREMCSLFGCSTCNVDPSLNLEVINARDLGLKYIYIPPNCAYNIKFGSPMTGAMANPQFIHCGGSCGYPGGCNNMSPACAALDKFTFTNLPARLCLLLWKSEPSTGEEKPDMTFIINYK